MTDSEKIERLEKYVGAMACILAQVLEHDDKIPAPVKGDCMGLLLEIGDLVGDDEE